MKRYHHKPLIATAVFIPIMILLVRHLYLNFYYAYFFNNTSNWIIFFFSLILAGVIIFIESIIVAAWYSHWQTMNSVKKLK